MSQAETTVRRVVTRVVECLDVEEDGRDGRGRREARRAQRDEAVVDQEAEAGTVRLLGLEQLARHAAPLLLGSTGLHGAAAGARHVRIVKERLRVLGVCNTDKLLHALLFPTTALTVRDSSHLLFSSVNTQKTEQEEKKEEKEKKVGEKKKKTHNRVEEKEMEICSNQRCQEPTDLHGKNEYKKEL